VCPYQCSPPERVMGWAQATFRHYEHRYMNSGSLASSLGLVHRQMSYEYFAHPLSIEPFWKDVMPSYRRLEAGELPAGYADGFVVDALVLEVPQLLDHLMHCLASDGVSFVKKEVHDIREACEAFDIVVNCTGIGSRWLLNDEQVFPLRGQVVRVRQVGCDRTVCDENGPNGLGYFISRKNDIILGGTAIKDDWSVEVDAKTTDQIMQRAENLSGGLLKRENLEVLDVKVGLRPARSEVRLEKETLSHDGGSTQKTVIHNYGHGGSGFTLAWGCQRRSLAL
jgi:D-amino-acid oxidase